MKKDDFDEIGTSNSEEPKEVGNEVVKGVVDVGKDVVGGFVDSLVTGALTWFFVAIFVGAVVKAVAGNIVGVVASGVVWFVAGTIDGFVGSTVVAFVGLVFGWVGLIVTGIIAWVVVGIVVGVFGLVVAGVDNGVFGLVFVGAFAGAFAMAVKYLVSKLIMRVVRAGKGSLILYVLLLLISVVGGVVVGTKFGNTIKPTSSNMNSVEVVDMAETDYDKGEIKNKFVYEYNNR